jgi:adenylate cyclase, class 2
LGHSSNIETEIKLRVESADAARALLAAHGFAVSVARIFESNVVYDTPDRALRARGELIRIRRIDDRSSGLLTFKAAPLPGKHKQREELETGVSDGAMLATVLTRLGLEPAFRYDKYRSEYRRPDGPGVVTLDETPIGIFLELEGPADWIDATAAELGFAEADYVLLSYAALYFEHCRAHRIPTGDMTFPH